MHYYEVAPNQIVRSDSMFFTYSTNGQLQIGQVVLIEIGKKQMVGVILRKVDRPNYKTKQIISVIEQTPLPSQLIKTAEWMSKYYVTPFASVLQTILPRGIQKKRHTRTDELHATKRDRTKIVFNNEQSSVLDTLAKNGPGTFLLQGVTGSGKTELYIE